MVMFLLFSVIISFLFIVGIKKKIEESIFDRQSNLALRGICAVEIVIGHVCTVTETTSLILYEKAMICGVGVFFLLSGYGLLHSFDRKENYLQNFLPKRFTSIVIPLIECFLLYIFILSIKNKMGFVQQLVNTNFVKFINWYIIELIIIYILFYLVFKLVDRYKALKVFYLLGIVAVVAMYYSGIHKCWYVSTLCFVLGFVIKDNEERLKEFLSKSFYLKASIALLIFGISLSCFFFEEKGIFLILVCRSWATLSFCIVVAVLCVKFRFGNKVINKIGEYSYSIYLYHIMLLQPMLFIFEKYGLIVYVVSLFAFSVILGILFEKLNAKVAAFAKSLRE